MKRYLDKDRLAECEQIMSVGNVAAKKLYEEFLGVNGRQVFLQIVFGGNSEVDAKLISDIRKAVKPHMPLIRAVRGIHDEVLSLVAAMQFGFASKISSRCKIIGFDEFLVEAQLATSNAVFSYTDLKYRFTTYSSRCAFNSFLSLIRFVRGVGKGKDRMIPYTDLPFREPASWQKFVKEEPEESEYCNGISVELVEKCFRNAKLNHYQREVMEARIAGEPLAEVARKHGKSRMVACNTYKIARKIVRQEISKASAS